MRLLHKHTATLSRVDTLDTYDAKGNYIPPTRVDSEITCVIQPPSKKSVFQDQLPEGIKSADFREIRTVTPIFTSDSENKSGADKITYNGVEFIVFIANPWSSPSERISHYEGVIIRSDFPNL